MALATRCPACTTVFRISTTQAAVKGGQVRCGICRHVFNSLDALVRVEDLDVVEEVIVDPADGTIAKVGAKAIATPDEAHVADALLAPTVRDERPTISEWWLPEVPPAAPPHPVRAPGATAAPLTGPHVDSLPPSGRPDDLASELSPIDGTNPVFMHPAAGTGSTSRPFRWALATLSLVAALVLVVQLAYLFRDELAVRWSPARPWLSSACALVGCRVGYPVHPAAITIESASVQTSAPVSNVYVLTALLRNRDGFDVRYPDLQLVLTDLRDQPILRRDLRPEDYLPPGRTPESGFPAQSELPVRVVFELNELRFVGFRLNQTYP
jgi:predicted Zn finger-like uncharacterized protein